MAAIGKIRGKIIPSPWPRCIAAIKAMTAFWLENKSRTVCSKAINLENEMYSTIQSWGMRGVL